MGSFIQVDRLRVGLRGSSGPLASIYLHLQRTHNIHPYQCRGGIQSHNDNKADPPLGIPPGDIEVARFACQLESFAMGTLYDPLVGL